MPIYKSLIIDKNTKVLIWRIEESLKQLYQDINLSKVSILRFKKIKKTSHKKCFLAVKQLFKKAGYNDQDIIYDDYGKPFLNGKKHISITHSFIFCGIIISDKPVGIDIEKCRKKIINISSKFTSINEYKKIKTQNNLIDKLTIVWGAKESVYKIYGKKQLSFLKNICVKDFSFDKKQATAKIINESKEHNYKVFFFKIEDFICVYAFKTL